MSVSQSESVQSLSMRYLSRSSTNSSWVAIDEDTIGSSDDEVVWPTTTSESEAGARGPEADDEEDEEDEDRDDYVLLSPQNARLARMRLNDSDAEDDRDVLDDRSVLATPTQGLSAGAHPSTGLKAIFKKSNMKHSQPSPGDQPQRKHYKHSPKTYNSDNAEVQKEAARKAYFARKKSRAKQAKRMVADYYSSPASSPNRADYGIYAQRISLQKQHYYSTEPSLPRVVPPIGLGARPVVDDTADGGFLTYEAASRIMTSYLNLPRGSFKHTPPLPIMHALLVELGLLLPADAPPASRSAARALLKGSAFVSVRAYMKARGGAQDALLAAAVFPSRSALRRAMLNGGGPPPAPRWWVKERGLGVLLIGTRFGQEQD